MPVVGWFSFAVVAWIALARPSVRNAGRLPEIVDVPLPAAVAR
jgi:hypothetical protein